MSNLQAMPPRVRALPPPTGLRVTHSKLFALAPACRALPLLCRGGSYLAEAAAQLAAAAPDVLTLRVLEKADCERLGMGCFLGVAEASAEPPKFIHLTYTPPGAWVRGGGAGWGRRRVGWGGEGRGGEGRGVESAPVVLSRCLV